MDELIKRLAIITVCIIVLAAAVIIIAAENAKKEDVPAADLSGYYYSEGTAVPETDPIEEAVNTEDTAQTSVTEESGEVTAVPEEIRGGTEETSKSRTFITSRAGKDYDSNAVYIDMENIFQLPELPVGCEITALTIMLRYCGFDAIKTDLAKNYLPASWGNARYEDGKTYKDSFFDYFIGDPFSKGYGCFSNAIEKAAKRYIADNGGGFEVVNLSGAEPSVLYDYVASGVPVICWATDGMIEPEFYETWFDNATGEQLDWYLNEHCFVLAGFNMSAGLVTLNDPMKGIIDYSMSRFELRYEQMYRQAIVILPDSGKYEPAAHLPFTLSPVTEPPETESPEEESSSSETSEEETGLTEDETEFSENE